MTGSVRMFWISGSCIALPCTKGRKTKLNNTVPPKAIDEQEATLQ
jgi:hypothetical protein